MRKSCTRLVCCPHDLESVASAVEGSDLGPTEDPFEPTASCIYDTNKRQLVTGSGLPRPRCCKRHLHHKQAMNSPAAVREFVKTVLQQVYHFKADVIAGDANTAAYKYYKKQEHQDLHDSSVAVMPREMQREVSAGHTFERRLHIDCSTNNHPPQLHAATDLDCCFMAILSWRKPAVSLIMRKPWSNLKPNHAMNFRDRTEGRKNGRDFARARNRSSVKGDSPASLPRPRGRHRSHGGTSRLRRSPICESWTPKQ